MCVCVCVCENSKKKKKKKKNPNWEKSHLNPIGKGAEFRPLRTPKKIPVTVQRCYFFCGSFMFLFSLVFAMSLCASVYISDVLIIGNNRLTNR